MDLGEQILKILNKKYEPLSLIETRFNQFDLAFKTDRDGLPLVAFVGHKDDAGKLLGERFARRLRQLVNGRIIKESWEYKGEACMECSASRN
ncbi:hypothetical protein [Paraflavitalea sp. CAU 1676]|uniref:hypothetical protein n=1 Tax=Paraflavitalea sp. CAU 1676 TaxID=3032598 RepID=UPI0023DC1B7F|nr:hypothetical protein [Paraflavitalea sp. CAU 1676]MDF2191049.1 hypothetical protein [Paraflavitalea sp. CAU 1676]